MGLRCKKGLLILNASSRSVSEQRQQPHWERKEDDRPDSDEYIGMRYFQETSSIRDVTGWGKGWSTDPINGERSVENTKTDVEDKKPCTISYCQMSYYSVPNVKTRHIQILDIIYDDPKHVVHMH